MLMYSKDEDEEAVSARGRFKSVRARAGATGVQCLIPLAVTKMLEPAVAPERHTTRIEAVVLAPRGGNASCQGAPNPDADFAGSTSAPTTVTKQPLVASARRSAQNPQSRSGHLRHEISAPLQAALPAD
eukprot:scaffold1200_cov236-Isochrysis_galbana.AAC.5